MAFIIVCRRIRYGNKATPGIVLLLCLLILVIKLYKDRDRVPKDNDSILASHHEQLMKFQMSTYKVTEPESSLNTAVPSLHKHTSEPQSGEILAKLVNTKCTENGKNHYNGSWNLHAKELYLLLQHKALYCPVAKVSSTFFKRILVMSLNKGKYEHPFSVPINTALNAPHHNTYIHTSKKELSSQLDGFFKFMFVRDPYQRLLSSYVDKVFAPNPYFWKQFGKPAILGNRQLGDINVTTNNAFACYHNATFTEFLQYVAKSVKSRAANLDRHFNKASDMCMVCKMNYTFIGKLESLSSDIPAIMKLLHVTIGPEHNLKELAAVDAIMDSIYSPYSWKPEIQACMDWQEAAQRIWRKLQIRGLIGEEQGFPVELRDADNIDQETFLQIALQARNMSNKEELSEQKKSMFRKMYSGVPTTVLESVRTAYSDDFKLFGYDDKPVELFG